MTVLFADLVGFTARAETLDPEDVEAILTPYHARLRAELERFGGTVEKFIGDAVMGVFGAPVAHEDDAERGVRAALAIRDWAQNEGVELRIAANTGEALVEVDALPGRGLVGDVVNTAARLQTAAPVNGILVGERTYRATRQVIAYREGEPVAAKGKALRIPVWEAVEARSRAGIAVRRERDVPLVGRERELDLLLDALARARTARPQLVTIVGVPGIGKSRLIDELFRSVDGDSGRLRWRQGGSLPYGQGVSLWALGEIVKAEAGVLETDTAAEADEKLRRTLDQTLPERSEREWVERHLRPLIGISAGEELGGDRRGEAFAAWRRLLEVLAEERPLVVVFEDLHWADEELLDFVDQLVERASDVPLLVVATARPELLARRAGWGGGKPNAVTLSLAPLSEEETGRLVHALLGESALAPEVEAALLARVGGNPLYAEEFVHLAAEQEGDISLPESVHAIIAARLDALPGEEKELLQAAAVVGKDFWLGALAQLGRRERWDVGERLHALARKEFVRREQRSRVAGETEYSFRHVLVRDVAYAEIPRGLRADKHRRAAEWIESLGRAEDHAEFLAHHYAQALEYARATGTEDGHLVAPARLALRGAGDRAAALNAFPAAIRFYREALALWPRDDRERPPLLLAYARALFHGDPPGAAVALEKARDELARAGDTEGAGEVASMESNRRWMQRNRERSFELVNDALALLEAVPASRSKAALLGELARLLVFRGEIDEAIDTGRRGLAMAEELGLVDLQARVLDTIGFARASGGDRGGLEDIERSVALARDGNAPDDVIRGYSNLSSICFSAGELERANEYHRAAVEAADYFGLAVATRWLRTAQIRVEYHAGRWDEAIRRADELVAEVEAGSPHYLEHEARSIRSLIWLARGDTAGALDEDVRQLRSARGLQELQVLYSALSRSAFVSAELGRNEEARSRTDELIASSRSSEAHASLALLALVADRLERTGELRAGLASVPGESLWASAAYAAVDRDFARAADVFARIGSLVYEAYARLRAAEQLAGEGRGAEVDEQLRNPLAFYRAVGAIRYTQKAESLLGSTA